MTEHVCHSLQCIMPPYMAESVKMRGSAQQKRMVAEIEKHADAARVARTLAAPKGGFFAAASLAPTDAASVKVRREVYDAKNKATLPGKLVRGEGDPKTNDAAADAAYDGAGDVHKLYLDVYHRNSLDGKGLLLKSSVHVRRNYNNAYWDGSQMAYGDGDGTIFTSLAESLSVIGHELSHGVVQFSGGLIYQDQSGALNESFADVFGALTVQHTRGQSAAEADWLIGGEILAPGIRGEALRSMKAPGLAYDDPILGKDPQPYHMDGYVNTSSDNGGVHINSGIPSHAFYLLAQYLGGNAWEKAGHIWYDTMQQIDNPHATFAEWAEKTIEVARTRHGSGSLEMTFTRRAWKLVGVSV